MKAVAVGLNEVHSSPPVRDQRIFALTGTVSRAHPSEISLTGEHGQRAASNPGGTTVQLDRHSAIPAQRGPLSRDVAQRHPAVRDEPLTQRGVQRAGHRILGDRAAITGEESPHLKIRRAVNTMRAGDPDVESGHQLSLWTNPQHCSDAGLLRLDEPQ